MQEDPEVVDLSGIPMDKTDEDIMEQEELTTDLGLDTNKPKVRDPEPYTHQALMADSHERQTEHKSDQMTEDSMDMDQEAKRKARARKILGR